MNADLTSTAALDRNAAGLAEALLGSWFLHEAHAVDPQGVRLADAYGPRPSGVIHYGADGRMTALITHDGRARLSGDRQAAPEKERAEAYRSCIAYAGRYTLAGDRVHHHVDVSTYPNWVGTVLTRHLSFEAEAAVLRTLPQMQAGVETVIRLVWRRAAPNDPVSA